MADDSVFATYRLETAQPLEATAAMLAGEQSSGTFVKVPGETPALTARHGAEVVALEDLGEIPEPSLPGARTPAEGPVIWRRARLRLRFPMANTGFSLTGIWTEVMGNLYEMGPVAGLKLTAIELPETLRDRYPGPLFGIGGTRRLVGVAERPLLGTIIKPSVGLSPEETAAMVTQLAEAGVDFIKDDELNSNAPYSPFAERARTVLEAIDRYAQKTGRRVMYALNVTGDIDQMKQRHDKVVALGGTCVMVNMLAVGLAGVIALGRHTQLPLHGHRAGWGMFARHPGLGMEYPVLGTFMRLAGVDHLHVNGLRNKFCESDESVLAAARFCQRPLLGSMPVMPVFSSGQTVLQVPDTHAAMGNADLMFLAGGGLFAHPDGLTAGVTSLREAWEAALAGESLDAYARTHKALARALAHYGQHVRPVSP